MVPDDDPTTAELLAQWAERYQSRDAAATEEWLRQHPERADDLRAGIALIQALGRAPLAAAGDPAAPAAPAGPAPAAPPESVLARLPAELRPSVQPALLRQGVEPHAPVVAPAPRTRGRYQIAGEIARGGIGVILKGQDVDLGREVAIKALRDDLEDEPEHVQRLVEEAQIGGQLQHPGIVPVYELAMDRDGRPFFSMKLVQGTTLAALLTARGDPTQDRARLLSIFQAVCQAVAYAHSRGVIHRDLKPANVMVGAFGEVLVVDWGMGKVLRHGGVADEARARESRRTANAAVQTRRSVGEGTPSLVGSIMGTPCYMPPEQARGAVDELDERADVFALGAILCEILTGEPPYVGSLLDVVRKAEAGELAGALSRLEATAADADLVALARDCLAPTREARPRDAGAVAARMTSYHAALEERRRAAEAEAARAELRAVEERRRRRLALALAASVVALALLGAGGWTWWQSERRARTESVAREVTAALDEAAMSRALATSAAADLGLWAEAVAAARRAEVLARSPDADAATRTRAAAVLEEVEARARTAQSAVREAEANRRLVRRLDEIRAARGSHFDLERCCQEYRDVLREHGIDLDGDPDLRALAERVNASRARLPIVLALAEWQRFERALKRPTQRLDAALEAVDSDPFRRRLRAASTLEELRALARETDVAVTPVESLLQLVGTLGASGDATAAADLAARVRAQHPSDFWAQFAAGSWATQRRPPRTEQAIRFYAAALALRPDSFAAHNNLGAALRKQGDLDGALEEFREALRLEPESAPAHNNVGQVLRARGDLDGAIAALREAVRIDPEYAEALNELGLALQDKGRMDEAIDALRRSTRAKPDLAFPHANLGGALRSRGDVDGAIAALREALRLDPDLAPAHASLGTALRARGDLDAALEAWRRATALDPKDALSHYNLGVAFRDKGDADSAIECWRRAVALQPTMADAHNNLGVGLFLKGDLAGAEPSLRRALELGPRDARTHATLGTVLRRKGDREGAIASFARALELDPTLAAVRATLVEALREAGRDDEARDVATAGAPAPTR